MTREAGSHDGINASVVVGPTEKWRGRSAVACELFLSEHEIKNPKYSYCKLIIPVGIATRYGLDGPGIEYRWRGHVFRTVQPGTVPT
jgi:hypothetical protein